MVCGGKKDKNKDNQRQPKSSSKSPDKNAAKMPAPVPKPPMVNTKSFYYSTDMMQPVKSDLVRIKSQAGVGSTPQFKNRFIVLCQQIFYVFDEN